MSPSPSLEELLCGQAPINKTTHKILDAAERCFLRIGVADTSMSNIISESGVARGTLYRYFKNKEQIVALAVIRDIRDIIDPVEKELSRYHSIEDKVVEVFYFTVTEMLKRPLLVKLFHQDSQLLTRVGITYDIVDEFSAKKTHATYTAIKSAGRLRPGVTSEYFLDWYRRQVLSFQTTPATLNENPQKLREYIRMFVLPSMITDS